MLKIDPLQRSKMGVFHSWRAPPQNRVCTSTFTRVAHTEALSRASLSESRSNFTIGLRCHISAHMEP